MQSNYRVRYFNVKHFILKAISYFTISYKSMNNIKEFVLECDFFAHGSFQRYKQEEAFRTIAGGIVSLVLVFFFVVVFSSMAISTFQKQIIISSEQKIYYDDPTYTELTTDPSRKFMFAIGITSMDLSSSQRYFDIVLTSKSYTKNGSNTIKKTQYIPLTPCNISQWSGISDSMQNSYSSLSFNQWLCPPTGYVFPLQGKFTSNIFKFAQIMVSKCTNNTLYPNTTCKNASDVTTFLNNYGQFTLNYYYINPVVNPQSSEFLSYYLEDSNYFSFDTFTGVSANLYYNDYKVTTDTTLLPWKQEEQVSGSLTLDTAVGQTYQLGASNQYFKLYLRKAPHDQSFSRSFQKLDQTFSYIGGLFSTIVLLLMFLNFYSKYSYELDIGDKIFKQNNGGSFGSENFNFVVFMGYLVFVIVSKFGIILNWKTMKRYHKCRMECQKQLNMDLLMQKLAHFQEISKIVLEQHHLNMLMMVPKPTIKQIKMSRKRYLMKSLVYHQIQRKGRDILIEQSEYQKRFNDFFSDNKNKSVKDFSEGQEKSQNSLKEIQSEMIECYKRLQSNEGEDKFDFSRKIMDRLCVKQMATAIYQFIKPQIYDFQQSQCNKYRQFPRLKKVHIVPVATILTETPRVDSQNQPSFQKIDSISDIITIPHRKNILQKL